MRTTVTLEHDVLALVRKAMRERGQTFKEAVNEALRSALGTTARPEPFQTPARSMGEPSIPLDHTQRVLAELDNEETVRKLSVGK